MTQTTKFKVNKNIKMPLNGRLPRKGLYPFDQMKKGDSFKFTSQDHKSIEGAARRHGRENKRKYSLHKMPNGEYRIWRIK